MKSEEHIKYQRDMLIYLVNIYIDEVTENCNRENLDDKIYNIQSLINTIQTLNWVLINEIENIVDYDDSFKEYQDIMSRINIDKLNEYLENV